MLQHHNEPAGNEYTDDEGEEFNNGLYTALEENDQSDIKKENDQSDIEEETQDTKENLDIVLDIKKLQFMYLRDNFYFRHDHFQLTNDYFNEDDGQPQKHEKSKEKNDDYEFLEQSYDQIDNNQVSRPISRQVQNIHPDFLNTNTEQQVQYDNFALNDNTNDQEAEEQAQKRENLSKEKNDDFDDFCRKLAPQFNNETKEEEIDDFLTAEGIDDFRSVENNDIPQFNIENNQIAELNFQADIPQFNIENNQDPELNSQVQVYNQDNFYISALFDQENKNFNITVVSESNFNHTCNYIN